MKKKTNMDKNCVGIDKKKDKKLETGNGVTPLVSRKILSIVKWVSIVVFVVVFILCVMGVYTCFLEHIQTWVNTLAIIFAAYVGGAYIMDTSQKDSKKAGKNFYSESYRSCSLSKMIKDYNKKYDKDVHEKAAEYVVDLLQSEELKYWKLVFYLQESDIDFLKVWNDFNFYFNKSMKWAWNSKYFDEVRKYVYMKVYQKGNRLQKQI